MCQKYNLISWIGVEIPSCSQKENITFLQPENLLQTMAAQETLGGFYICLNLQADVFIYLRLIAFGEPLFGFENA